MNPVFEVTGILSPSVTFTPFARRVSDPGGPPPHGTGKVTLVPMSRGRSTRGPNDPLDPKDHSRELKITTVDLSS